MKKTKRIPYKRPEDRVSKNLVVRLKEKELDDLREAATRSNLTMSEYIREHIALSKLTNKLSGLET